MNYTYHPTGKRWPEERESHLRELWKTNSGSQCAKILGISRSAVMGRLYRMGLLGNKSRVPPRPSARFENNKPGYRAGKPKPIVILKLVEEQMRKPKDRPVLNARLLHLLELDDHSCRFPMEKSGFNNTVYCGAECDDQDRGPYCDYHKPVMYNPVQR